jgi:hypothetical protein
MAYGMNLAFLDPAASAAGPKPCSAISLAMVFALTHQPGAHVRGNHASHSCGGRTGSRWSPPTPPVVYAVVTDPLAPLVKPRLRHSSARQASMPCSALWAAIMAVLERDVPKRSAALRGKEAMRRWDWPIRISPLHRQSHSSRRCLYGTREPNTDTEAASCCRSAASELGHRQRCR